MDNDISKILKLDKSITTYREEIDKLNASTSKLFHESISLKEKVIMKNIIKGHVYHLYNTDNKVSYGTIWNVCSFHISLCRDNDNGDNGMLELNLETTSGSKYLDSISFSEIYDLFSNTHEFTRLYREGNLGNLLG